HRQRGRQSAGAVETRWLCDSREAVQRKFCCALLYKHYLRFRKHRYLDLRARSYQVLGRISAIARNASSPLQTGRLGRIQTSAAPYRSSNGTRIHERSKKV